MADPIVDDLLDLFSDVLGVQPGVYDQFGEFTPVGASFEVRCKISSGRNRHVMDTAGQIQVSTMSATCAGVYNLQIFYEYTLPVRFIPNKPKAMAVHKITDENGPHHETVYF